MCCSDVLEESVVDHSQANFCTILRHIEIISVQCGYMTHISIQCVSPKYTMIVISYYSFHLTSRIKHICPHKDRVTSCVELNIYRKQYTSWGRSSGIKKMFPDKYLCSKFFPVYIFDSCAEQPTRPFLFAEATRPAFPRTLNIIYSFVVRKDIQER